jgi:hypothetical protein
MGEVAGLRRTWKAPDEPMDEELPTFEGFFEDQKERLLRILSVITGSRAEGEDLAQEAFTRVFERWETVAAMEDPAGYLHRTAMNLFRNQYRRAPGSPPSGGGARTRSGALDPTFGGDGRVVTGFAGGGSRGEGVAIQADGRIVAGGTLFTGAGPSSPWPATTPAVPWIQPSAGTAG